MVNNSDTNVFRLHVPVLESYKGEIYHHCAYWFYGNPEILGHQRGITDYTNYTKFYGYQLFKIACDGSDIIF